MECRRVLPIPDAALIIMPVVEYQHDASAFVCPTVANTLPDTIPKPVPAKVTDTEPVVGAL